MKKKILSIGMAALLLCYGVTPILQAEAAESELSYTEEISDRTEGLIDSRHNSITNSNGNISLTAWTQATATMSSIGLTSIKVERSSNGITWVREKTMFDQLASNTNLYSVSGYSIYVTGGFYYRIRLNHYADNGYGTTQTDSSTSNVVWIASHH